jgi:uncharacterized glyoxalase superfamily protein PhnB
MATNVAPMLAVSDPARAIDFYKDAFGAIEHWRIDGGGGGPVVAGLSIDGAEFFLASSNPPSTEGPDVAGATTVRIELFVDDPEAVFERAAAVAGVQKANPVTLHEHATVDGGSFRMLQGGITDPFGHIWLIGRFLD